LIEIDDEMIDGRWDEMIFEFIGDKKRFIGIIFI